jgi:17beta-estradiol 17-dehydrogenase / very-long-chain 3-oxoacyl-CoA reductase
MSSRLSSVVSSVSAWLVAPATLSLPAALGGVHVATVAPSSVLACLGGAYLLSSVVAPLLSLVAAALWRAALRPSPRRYGKWAVVTGGSDGIGLAYATELARRGMSVAILARDAGKLRAAKESIEAAVPGAAVVAASVDFSAAGCKAAAAAALFRHFAADDVGVLVNNVGVSYPGALYFDPVELDKDAPGLRERLVAVNVAATTEMTALLLPSMLARRSGAIINIGSGYGRLPTGAPLYAQYCASKAYVDFLSRSLHHEVKGRGVHVQCQSPFMVATELSGIRRPTMLAPSARTYARAAVDDIGAGASTVPYLPHTLLDWLLHALPERLVAAYFLAHHVDLRERYIRKVKREADKRAQAAGAAAAPAAPATGAAAAAAGAAGNGAGSRRANSRSRKTQ